MALFYYFSAVRRLITTLLIICILFQSGGVLLYYQVSFVVAQHHMKKRLESGVGFHEMTILDLNHDQLLELEWKKKKREFRFEGEMYDVVSEEKTDNGMRYYCVCDKEETQLRNNIANFTKKHRDQKSRSAHDSIVKIVKMLKKQRDQSPEGYTFYAAQKENILNDNYRPKGYLTPSILTPLQPPEWIL